MPEKPEDEAPTAVSEEEKQVFLAAMEALEISPRKSGKASIPPAAESASAPSVTPVEKAPDPDPVDPAEHQLFLAAVASLDSPPDKDQPAARQEQKTGRVIKLKTPKRDSVHPDDTLDLHGLTVDAALTQLEGFVAEAAAQHHKILLVITGKGHHSRDGFSVLREAVLTWIRQQGRARIEAYSEAPPARGGRGALFFYLRAPGR